MVLNASMKATAVFLLVPVASANSVASCVLDNFFPFAISSRFLFLDLVSVSVHRLRIFWFGDQSGTRFSGRIHPSSSAFQQVSKRYPCFGRPSIEPAKQGISATRRLLHQRETCN